ncbi:MAG: GIY-YIG nuclease family protein [Bacilli bacterium]
MKIKLDSKTSSISIICHENKTIFYFKFGNIFEVFEAIYSTKASCLISKTGDVEIHNDSYHEDILTLEFPEYEILLFNNIATLRKTVITHHKQLVANIVGDLKDKKGVYYVYNNTLNKSYIGSTSINFLSRLERHLTQKYIPIEILEHPDTKFAMLKEINSNNKDTLLQAEEEAIKNHNGIPLINKELKPFMNKR